MLEYTMPRKTTSTEDVRRWRQANPERSRELNRASRLRNKEKRLEANRRWREANREKQRQMNRDWKKRNPEKARANWARRRARRIAQLGPSPQDHIKAIFIAMQWLRAQGVDVHVDHIVPLAAGGAHDASNLAIVPASYNTQKGDKVL
jgi:5-methylcytosine-specific restriction endonuclease McrA